MHQQFLRKTTKRKFLTEPSQSVNQTEGKYQVGNKMVIRNLVQQDTCGYHTASSQDFQSF